jgi:alanine dehydrogenase
MQNFLCMRIAILCLLKIEHTAELHLSEQGWQRACKESSALFAGLNVVGGKVTFKAVADVYGLKYEPITL